MSARPTALRPVARGVALAALALLVGCASAAKTKAAPTTEGGARRAQVEATLDPMKLQSGLLALADTSVQRVATATQIEGLKVDSQTRQRVLATRLALSSALYGIVTGPDQIDALLDVLTHTALVAEAQRNAAAKAGPGTLDARLSTALDRNEADAWTLAEQWLDADMRKALRARIAALPLERTKAAEVAYVRIADLPRAGGASIDSGSGISDSLRAATQQADQVRLLAERSLFLMQRMPFLMRWQAQAYSYDTLNLDEMQRLLTQLDALTKASTQAAQMVETLPGIITRERHAALDDLFNQIRIERQLALEQLAVVVRDERSATLNDIAGKVALERKATFEELSDLVGDAELRSSNLLWILVLAGVILIFVFLAGLLGMMLLYRRYLPRVTKTS